MRVTASHLDKVLPHTIKSIQVPLAGPEVENFTVRAAKIAQRLPGETRVELMIDGHKPQSVAINLTLPSTDRRN